MRLTKWISRLVVAALILLGMGAIFSYIVLAFDPWGWGKVTSSKFSWEKFAEVRSGEDINSVIDRLGPPVRPAEPLAIMGSDPGDPCVRGGCRKYLFAGGAWGPTFKEAIVIVDSKQHVVSAQARQE